MAEALYLATRASGDEGSPMINGVTAVLFNNSDGLTDAQRLVNAAGYANTANLAGETLEGPTIFPDNYFDTITLVSTASGNFASDGDYAIFGGIGTEAGVNFSGD